MPQPSNPQFRESEPSTRSDLRVRFESVDAFREEYHGNIGKGALFVASEDPHAVGERVEVQLDLEFCGASLVVPGEVVVVVDPVLAEAGATSPGISLRLTEDTSELRRKLERLAGVSLDEKRPGRVGDRRVAERSGSNADIRIETRDGQFWGVTANLSYAGVLALLWRSLIPVGTEVRAVLSNPEVELELFVDGRIVHQTRCDEGMIAHGIQLQYPAHRIDEVMSFIDFLRAFDRARRLAVIAGEIGASGLGPVLDMFANTTPSGTLIATRGEEEGKIVFADNAILCCTLGIVSGLKALSRMFRWTEGRFEFHHDLQLTEEPEKGEPLEAAMMSASVQMDEIARIDRGHFASRDVFTIDRSRAVAVQDTLDETEKEVLEYATEGFKVDAIADLVAASDAEIYKALQTLLEAGVIRVRRR